MCISHKKDALYKGACACMHRSCRQQVEMGVQYTKLQQLLLRKQVVPSCLSYEIMLRLSTYGTAAYSTALLHCHGASRKDLFYLCKLPFFVAQGASTSCLEPALNAVKVKDMPTVTPCNAQARMICISCGVSLVLNTRLIQVVAADCTCVCADSPGPHSYCIPFLDFKSLAKFSFALHKVS